MDNSTPPASASGDPYLDGSVPADADFAPAGTDDAGTPDADASDADAPGNDAPDHADEEPSGLSPDGDVGTDQLDSEGGQHEGQPDALVENGRVATAEDME